MNERRSMRDPYQEPEFDDRKRSLVERLPPKNIDLRESLEEEKRRKQEYVEPYPGREMERKRGRKAYGDNVTQVWGFDEVRPKEQQSIPVDYQGEYGRVGEKPGYDQVWPGPARGGKWPLEHMPARGRRGAFRN